LNPDDPEKTQLKQMIDSAWQMAMDQTKADFKPTYSEIK